MEATVSGLYITPEEAAPIERVDEVTAVAGLGIEGDRYYNRHKDLPEGQRSPEDEITLFQQEGVDRVNSETDLGITYEDMRRNVMTHGVDLDSLIGKRFKVGEVELEGLEPNPPCRHLQALAGKPLLKPMIDDAGIRARIVSGGTIRKGDPISF